MPSLLETLLSLASPKSAEAKVVGSPEAMRILRGMVKPGEPGEAEDYLRQRYRQIVKRAEQSPSQVEVRPGKELLAGLGAAGAYYPDAHTVIYEPTYPIPDLHENFAHELVHFLATESNKGKARPEEEHRLISKFLGTDTFDPEARFSKSGFTPGPEASLKDLETFEGWMVPPRGIYDMGREARPVMPATP